MKCQALFSLTNKQTKKNVIGYNNFLIILFYLYFLEKIRFKDSCESSAWNDKPNFLSKQFVVCYNFALRFKD